jgi:hypothetical protein
MPNKPKKVPAGFHRMPDGSLMKGKSHGAKKKAPAKKAAPRRSATRRNNMDY